jgi:hypothetical protein
MRGERRQYLTFDQLEHEQTERKIEFSRLTLNQPSMRMKKVHPSRDRKKSNRGRNWPEAGSS